jgi:sugar lactone lactonase YvrE
VNVRLVSDEVAELGEGPRLDARTGEVLWVDITAGRLHRCRWQDGRLRTLAVIEVGRQLGAVAPVDAPGGGWVAAAGQGFAHVAEDGTVTVLAEPEAAKGGRTRMNDGACDPQGRLWAGSMAYASSPGAGSLYRMDHDGTVTPVLTGVTISNGLGWSPDGTTMYSADSGAGTPGRLGLRRRQRRAGAAADPGPLRGGRVRRRALRCGGCGVSRSARWSGAAGARTVLRVVEKLLTRTSPARCPVSGPA